MNRLPAPPRPVDWPSVLHDISAAGISLATVARHIGYSPLSLRNWRYGGIEPRHRAAEWVLMIWRDVKGNDDDMGKG